VKSLAIFIFVVCLLYVLHSLVSEALLTLEQVLLVRPHCEILLISAVVSTNSIKRKATVGNPLINIIFWLRWEEREGLVTKIHLAGSLHVETDSSEIGPHKDVFVSVRLKDTVLIVSDKCAIAPVTVTSWLLLLLRGC